MFSKSKEKDKESTITSFSEKKVTNVTSSTSRTEISRTFTSNSVGPSSGRQIQSSLGTSFIRPAYKFPDIAKDEAVKQYKSPYVSDIAKDQAVKQYKSPFVTDATPFRSSKTYSNAGVSSASSYGMRPPRTIFNLEPSKPAPLVNTSYLLPSNRYTNGRSLSVSTPPSQKPISSSGSMSRLEGAKKLNIKVKKSIRFLDGDQKIPTYLTRTKNRGKALIINNIEFGKNSRRNGAEVDEENLKNLFQDMGKWKVKLEKNLTVASMQSVITRYVKNNSTEKYDINVVVIMSHGSGEKTSDSTGIVGKDDRILPITWIIEQFSNFMKGKPKIFIFQCCRGDQLDQSVIQTDARQNSDMLLAYATVPGFVSHRDTKEGTWYIQLLCETIMENAHDTDIEGILKIVDNKLSKMITVAGTQQTSNYENRGFKRCYLHPGLWN